MNSHCCICLVVYTTVSTMHGHTNNKLLVELCLYLIVVLAAACYSKASVFLRPQSTFTTGRKFTRKEVVDLVLPPFFLYKLCGT